MCSVNTLDAVSIDQDIILNCPLTPEIFGLQYPAQRPVSRNNLLYKEGSAYVAQGTYIKVEGVVTDSMCTPIGDAVIKMWQLDSYGNSALCYSDDDASVKRWTRLRNKLQLDENFLGFGYTLTDNLGRFIFYTVLPGAVEQEVPHLNFYVEKPGFNIFRTQMFFPQFDNYSDQNIKMFKLNHSQIKLITARNTLRIEELHYGMMARIYAFNIVMEGTSMYKQY